MSNHIEDIKNLTFENDKTGLTYFSERVIKQIVKKDDENTKQMIIDYAKRKYPNENVRIDFIDEEKVNLIIELGLQEYQKRQNEQYDTKVLGKFNIENNNIEDIKIVEEMLKDKEEIIKYHSWIGSNTIQSIENILNAYKENQKIIEMKDGDIEWLQRKINNHFIDKQVIRDIINECIPKKQNVITGKEEYTLDTNANSYLVQKILKLFEKED